MYKKNLKLPSVLIISIILTLGLSIALQSVLAVWSSPTETPPTCASGNPGCDAPINAGSTDQTKTGGLTINGNLGTLADFSVIGDSIFTGNVAIGTTDTSDDAAGRLTIRGDGDDWNYSQLTLKNSNDSSAWHLNNRKDSGLPGDGGFTIEEERPEAAEGEEFMPRIAIKSRYEDNGRIFLNPAYSGFGVAGGGVSIGSDHTNSETDDIGDLQVHRETKDKPAMILIDGRGDGDNYATLVLMEYRDVDSYLAPRWSILHREAADINEKSHGLVFNYYESGTDSARMVIDDGGNVGIGTWNPGTKLEVNGGLHVGNDRNANALDSSFSFHDYQVGAGTYTQLVEENWSAGHALLWNAYKYDPTSNGPLDIDGKIRYANDPGDWQNGAGMIQFDANYGNMYFRISPVSTGKDDDITWGTSVMTLLRSGEVGIGTEGPGEKLEVAGNIKASGDVITDGTLKTDSECGIPGAMLQFERSNVSGLGSFMAVGDGSSSWGIPMACSGTINAISAQCQNANSSDHVAFYAKIDDAYNSCSTNEINAASQGFTTSGAPPCGQAFAKDEIVGCWAGTVSGSSPGPCTCAIYVSFD